MEKVSKGYCLENLEEVRKQCSDETYEFVSLMIESYLELIDKTTAKKIIEEDISPCVLTRKFCPSCGEIMKNFSYQIPYCEHCGQKLKF